jgi:hypothetical protein
VATSGVAAKLRIEERELEAGGRNESAYTSDALATGEADCLAVAGRTSELPPNASASGLAYTVNYHEVVSGTARGEVGQRAATVGDKQRVVALFPRYVVLPCACRERVIPRPTKENVEAAETSDVVVTGKTKDAVALCRTHEPIVSWCSLDQRLGRALSCDAEHKGDNEQTRKQRGAHHSAESSWCGISLLRRSGTTPEFPGL